MSSAIFHMIHMLADVWHHCPHKELIFFTAFSRWQNPTILIKCFLMCLRQSLVRTSLGQTWPCLSKIIEDHHFILLYCIPRGYRLKVQGWCNLQSIQERKWRFSLSSAPELKVSALPQDSKELLCPFKNQIGDTCFCQISVKKKQNIRKDLASH